MSRTKQNIIVLQEPLNDAFDISLQAGNMLSNRFCIDEEAGFEFSGVYHLKGYKLCSHYNSHPSIESAFQKISEHKAKDLEPHFVYGGEYHLYSIHESDNPLRSSLLELMKKYQIESVTLTIIYMEKEQLITKEMMESYCKGEHYPRNISVNEDLETLFQDLQLGKEPSYDAITYYLPKLTVDEMTLVEKKDQTYFQKFFTGVYPLNINYSKKPDVDDEEMKMSESRSKFILAKSHRKSLKLKMSTCK